MTETRKEFMRKAWLAKWGHHGTDEDSKLREYGIRNSVADIISVRKPFSEIIELAEEMYAREILYPTEKMRLADYAKGARRRRAAFETSIPVLTHYMTPLYRDLMKATDKDIGGAEREALLEKWMAAPKHVTVGHNPYIQIVLVKNLAAFSDGNRERLEWDRPLADGTTRHEACEIVPRGANHPT